MTFPRPLLFASILSFGMSLITGWYVFTAIGAALLVIAAYKERNS